jgi:DNA polymerase II small subunit/DNA polymerase delta subunit B
MTTANPLQMSIGADADLTEVDFNGYFVSDDDQVILEDSSGRINIRPMGFSWVNEHITGSIVAILGKADKQGYFIVEDFCYAGIPFKADFPNYVEGMTFNKRALFDPFFLKESGQRKMIAFVSGLNFGGLGDTDECQAALLLLASFLRGQHPNP